MPGKSSAITTARPLYIRKLSVRSQQKRVVLTPANANQYGCRIVSTSHVCRDADNSPVKEPWTSIVRNVSDRNIVATKSGGCNVASDRIFVIIRRTAGTPNNAEGMLFLNVRCEGQVA